MWHLASCYLYFLFQTFTPKLVLLDFSDMENILDVITAIGECYGCVDVLICNSSMKIKAPVQNLSLEMDKTVMDVNYFGPITLAKGRQLQKHSEERWFTGRKNVKALLVFVAGILPLMITRRMGQFVLVNSIQGKLALPFRTCCKSHIHHLLTNGSSAVNGCRQNESPNS